MFDNDLKCITNSRNVEEKIKFKIVKVMKFTSKTRSSHVLLSINDKFLRSHLDVLHLSTLYNNRDHHEILFSLNNYIYCF
jgi:hypothetical protein